MGTQGNDALPCVHIISFPDTSDTSDDIIREFDRLGVDASAPAPTEQGQVRAVVVLLSAPAIADPVWLGRLEALRAERLVPVRVGDLVDEDVPEFLRELNWVYYRQNDPSFVAQLFTGINTDASRFRNTRDTRALAERWEAEDRNPDFLLGNLSEVKSRINAAATTADGSDPLVPREQVVQLVGTFRVRFRVFFETLVVGDDAVPVWFARLAAAWMASFRGMVDKLLIAEGTTPVAFLAASRQLTSRGLRRRLWRAIYRTAIAAVTVATILFTVVSVQQAIKKNNNSISFAIGGTENSYRPDLAAFKAGASLVDSGTYAGDDGRLRIVIDALSQHWPLGFLTTDQTGIATARILTNGSIMAFTQGGSMFHWSSSLDSRSESPPRIRGMLGGDISPADDITVVTDGAEIVVIEKGAASRTGQGLGDIAKLRLAPAEHRLMVQSGDELFTVDGIGSVPNSLMKLGRWDSVLDMVQTDDGHAVALAELNGELQLVHDDGRVDSVGEVPGAINEGALATNGISFALDVAGQIWTSFDGRTSVSSGISIPGVVMALGITNDGLVLVSDRTRGSWVAEPHLGINLGRICNAVVGTTGFLVQAHGDRVVCIQGAVATVDSLAQIRPAAVGQAPQSATYSIESDGQMKSLSLADGLIRLERADGSSFAFDSAGLSFAPGFVRPSWVDHVKYFATGALLGASGLPTSVAATPDGNTFAIGFADGGVIEVDLNKAGAMARVGSWQLPDHSAVEAISWSPDRATISATTIVGTTWNRPSCSGCWGSHALTEHIASRSWFCYAKADIDELGDTTRTAFRLRSCESLWGGKQ